MIKLEKPKFNQKDIVNDCILNIRDADSKQRILDCIDEIADESIAYDEKAIAGNLSSLSSHDKLKNGATKDDMVKLYNRKFAKKGELGRKYYDAIKLLSPNLICPYCAQRDVDTLDHYLPKSKYPTYAITPYNLIPSCMGCNKAKVDSVYGGREEETIHPYYDDFTSEKWIVAEMIEGDPITFRFMVKCPDTWDSIKKVRAKKHFESFKLNELYKNKAAQEFIGCFNRIKRLYKRGGSSLAIEDLKEHIEDKNVVHLNTWQAAMYQAIIDDEWFWKEYMPQSVD